MAQFYILTFTNQYNRYAYALLDLIYEIAQSDTNMFDKRNANYMSEQIMMPYITATMIITNNLYLNMHPTTY